MSDYIIQWDCDIRKLLQIKVHSTFHLQISFLRIFCCRSQKCYSCRCTLQASLDEATDPWGVKVERVEMSVSFSHCFSLLSLFCLTVVSLIEIFLCQMSKVNILKPSYMFQPGTALKRADTEISVVLNNGKLQSRHESYYRKMNEVVGKFSCRVG